MLSMVEWRHTSQHSHADQIHRLLKYNMYTRLRCITWSPIPVIFPSAHTAWSLTLECSEDNRRTNRGTAPASTTVLVCCEVPDAILVNAHVASNCIVTLWVTSNMKTSVTNDFTNFSVAPNNLTSLGTAPLLEGSPINHLWCNTVTLTEWQHQVVGVLLWIIISYKNSTADVSLTYRTHLIACTPINCVAGSSEFIFSSISCTPIGCLLKSNKPCGVQNILQH